MKHILSSIDAFFFRKISAGGFGLLRMFWGAVIFYWMITALKLVPFFYTDSGIMPVELGHLSFRSVHRFTVLSYFTSPLEVYAIYSILIVAALCTSIGFAPRISTILTTVLFFSFQERNLLPLGGGDTTLRCIGFILCVSPHLDAFSLKRLRQQWQHWKKHQSYLPAATMSIWPYYLLLWQIMIIYVYSAIEKGLGHMWWAGTAPAATYHHTHFTLPPRIVMDFMSGTTVVVAYYTLLYEFAWLLMLVPTCITKRLPQWIEPGSLKRALLLGGVLFHVGIALTMNVGIFAIAMLISYFGLLHDEDWVAIKSHLNRKKKGAITLLYDGTCGLCKRSVWFLGMMDGLDRLAFVDFHDEKKRKAIDPDLQFVDLDKAMHMVTPAGRTEKGFDGFRLISWDILWLWPIAPLLYIPGVPYIGRKIYAAIAQRRKRCDGDSCSL